jgi:hypothetical protein
LDQRLRKKLGAARQARKIDRARLLVSKPLSFLGWLCLRPIDDMIAVSPWDLQLFDSDARNLADDVLERVALLRATFAYGFYVIFD